MKVRRMMWLQITLAVVILLIILLYVLQQNTNFLPQTKVYLTNTTIIGKVLG